VLALFCEVLEGHESVVRFFGEAQHVGVGKGALQGAPCCLSVRRGFGWKQDYCGRIWG
jgi:hypothetical protein